MKVNKIVGGKSAMKVNRFVAAFDSECASCSIDISEGDEASYVNSEVCCEECCDDADDEDD